MGAIIKTNYKSCTGCHLCEYACSAKHFGCFGIAGRIKIKNDEFEGTNKPVLCRQCANPKCKAACPVDAIKILAGGVVCIDSLRCIKCRICVAACPFNAMSQSSDGDILVCDLCEGHPACVWICPSGALSMEEE